MIGLMLSNQAAVLEQFCIIIWQDTMIWKKNFGKLNGFLHDDDDDDGDDDGKARKNWIEGEMLHMVGKQL
jgi:hypothetical protein